MNSERFQVLLRFFKALADESRLKILSILATQECSVEELAALLQLKEPTVSHHLTKLKEVKLVSMRPEGNAHLYQLDSEAWQSLSREALTTERIASLVEDVNTNAWENKILKTYVQEHDEGLAPYLKEIPANRKKRLVILRWLVNQFELGVSYPESTVNDILRQYYHDYVTLRRELINSLLMQQENGVYWRKPD